MGDPSSLSRPFTAFFPPLAAFARDQHGACICWNPRLNFTISSHQLLYVSVIHISAETGSSYKACWCGSGSISCHNVDLCWEGIPRGVEAKTACIVNMALPCWLGLNTKAFFTLLFLRKLSSVIFMHFLSCFWKTIGIQISCKQIWDKATCRDESV